MVCTLNKLKSLNQPCIVCKTKNRDKTDSKYCSKECSSAKTCKWCFSIITDIKAKFCSNDCKSEFQKQSIIPLCYREDCSFFIENKFCIFKDRCWAKHPTDSNINQNIIVQIDKSQKTRVQEYLQTTFNQLIVAKSMPQNPLTVTNKHEQELVCVDYNNVDDILSNTIMGSIVQRVQAVQYRYSNLEMLINQMKLDCKDKLARLQISPKNINDRMNPQMDGKIKLDNSNQEIVCSIIETEDGQLQGWFIPLIENKKQIGWNGGRKIELNSDSNLLDSKLKIEDNLSNKDIICRAAFKITELLSRSSQINNYFKQNKSESYALDIGASPGGWTYALCSNVIGLNKVYSIDPGKIDQRILSNEKVAHIPLRFEKVIEHCQNDDTSCDDVNQSDIKMNIDKVKLIVNDMNISPETSIKMIEDSRKIFNNIELIIVTLKSQSQKDVMLAMEKYIDQQIELGFNVESYHLFSNTSFERTLAIQMK